MEDFSSNEFPTNQVQDVILSSWEIYNLFQVQFLDGVK
jgi:hypothetical protein